MDCLCLDITADKIHQLQAIFPEVFTEDKIDFNRLLDVLGRHVTYQN